MVMISVARGSHRPVPPRMSTNDLRLSLREYLEISISIENFYISHVFTLLPLPQVKYQ